MTGSILLTLAALAGPAEAAVPSLSDDHRRWVFVGEKFNTRAYVDAASVRREGMVVRFAVRTDWLRPQRDGAAGMISGLRGDCATRELETVSFAKFADGRRELASGAIPAVARQPAPVPADTLPGAMLDFACRSR